MARQKRLKIFDSSDAANCPAVENYLWKLASDTDTVDAVPAALQTLEDDIAWQPFRSHVSTGGGARRYPAVVKA